MQYWISVSQEKFDTEKFLLEAGPKAKGNVFSAEIAPRDEALGDYHIFATWNLVKEQVRLFVEYEPGPKKHEKDEHEPYAEQFMEWLGRFFKHENAQAHIHARFQYPLEAKQSKFPLPLKTALEGDAEIEGISLRLPTRPRGVNRVRLVQGVHLWYVETVGDRRITFKGFTPYEDVQAFTSVIDTFMEDKNP
jgi:hypothetical protein